ncbi:MAG: glycosyltransferase, partial [Gammaproteobacteria bacterium]
TDLSRHQAQVYDDQYYRQWLFQRYARDTLETNRREAAAYATLAQKSVPIGKTIHTPFAPFRPELSAGRLLTTGQQIFFVLLAVCLIWQLYRDYTAVLMGFFATVTVFYIISLFINLTLTLKSVTTPTHITIDEALIARLVDADWPRYTILCPLYREEESAPQLVRAISEIDYPSDRLQVLMMLEKDDHGTLAVLHRLHLPPFVELVILPEGTPRTKPRSCNYGLTRATGDYAVIYDAEDIPDPLQLKKAVLAFAQNDDKLACVQSKLNFYNVTQNALTRWFTIEYATWYEMIMPSMRWAHLSIPLGGTSNHFPTRLLREIGAWDAFNVTEDCELGMRLEYDGYYTTVLDSTTYEEANSELGNWLTQRTRWIKGFLITYLVYMRNPARYIHPSHWAEFLSLQFIIGGRTLVVLLNPLLWISMLVYLLYGERFQDFYDAIIPAPVFYLGLVSSIFGNLAFIYTHMLAVVCLQRYDLVRWAFIMPLYWILHSIAGYRALFNYIFAPHFWEKTRHGLHRKETPVDFAAQSRTIDPGSCRLYDRIDLAHRERFRDVVDHRQIGLSGSRHKAYRKPLLACVFSIAGLALWWVSAEGLTLASGESGIHLYLANRLLNSTTPGFSQLSPAYLPLYHLLTAPLTLNNTLFTTGMAGSLISALSYSAAVIYLYLIAEIVTNSRKTALLGTLVFALNPNVLFLQAVPSEIMLTIATLLATSYYLLRWLENYRPTTILALAAASFLATLASYSGWLLFGVVLLIVAYSGKQRGIDTQQNASNLILYMLLGGLGIVLWTAWNGLVPEQPVGFNTVLLPSECALLANRSVSHDLVSVGRVLFHSAVALLGPVLIGVAVFGFAFLVQRMRRASLITLGVSTTAIPAAALLLALLTGQTALLVPPLDATHLLNIDQAVVLIAPLAILIALSAQGLYSLAGPGAVRQAVFPIGLLLIIGQTGWMVTQNKVLTLNEARAGISAQASNDIVRYLARHYTGGLVWMSSPNGLAYPLVTQGGVSTRKLIHAGSSKQGKGLAAPPARASWIIVNNADPNDRIARLIAIHDASYLIDFDPVVSTANGETLYRRREPEHQGK